MTDSKATPRVRVLFLDQLNLARGKYIPPEHASTGGVHISAASYALTYTRGVVPAPGAGLMEGLPDVEVVFDPEALRPGWEEDTQIALGSLERDGEPYGLCGRSALKKAVEDWRELGFEPMVGLEGEAYVLQKDHSGRWVPYDAPGSYLYGNGPFVDPAGLMDEVWKAAHRCGLPVEAINSEHEAGQFELTLRYADALKACDDFFLFRLMARELLYKRGYLLTFMPKPVAKTMGNGMHINFSLSDAKGRNAMDGTTSADALSDLVKGCIAGLLHRHCSLCALVAPTVNSYQRLKPLSLSGYWANWGFDHRGTAVRVSAGQGAAARLEYRLGDCAASPYVAVAAMLQAARLGFTGGLELPPPETGDGLTTVNTERHAPESLGDALGHLLGDDALVDAVGRLLVENFAAIKGAEIKELEDADHDAVFDYYAPFI